MNKLGIQLGNPKEIICQSYLSRAGPKSKSAALNLYNWPRDIARKDGSIFGSHKCVQLFNCPSACAALYLRYFRFDGAIDKL